MRVLLIALFLIFILSLVAIVFLPGAVNVSAYRDNISKTIEDIVGRKITIHGAVDFNIFPTPRISIEQLSIRNRLDAKHDSLLTIQKLHGELSLLSLIKGDIKMTNLVLVSPVFNFDVLPSGEKAWVRDVGEKDSNVLKRVTETIHFDKVKLQDASFRYYNGIADKQYEINRINADIVSESLQGPLFLSGAGYYEPFDVKFNITSGKVTGDGNAPVRIEIQSEKAGLNSNFAGVLTLYENGKETFELQGEAQLALKDIDRLDSFSFIGGMEASLVKAKGFVTLNNHSLRWNNLVGEIGQNPLQGKLDMDFTEKGEVIIDARFKTKELTFSQIKTKESFQTDKIIGKIPLGKISLDLDKISFEDAILTNISLSLEKKQKSIHFENVQAILPGQVGMEASGVYEEKGKTFDADFNIQRPQEFFDWIKFPILEKAKFEAGERARLKISLQEDAETKKKTYTWQQDGKGFEVVFFENNKNAQKSINMQGDFFDADKLGLSNVISKNMKEYSWLKNGDWDINVGLKQIIFNGKSAENVFVDATNKKSELHIEALNVENFFNSTVKLKGSYDIHDGGKPFDLLFNIQSKDLQQLVKNSPVAVSLPEFNFGEVDLSLAYAHKNNQKNIKISGLMMGGDWQIEGSLSDIKLQGDYQLTLRAQTKNTEKLLSHFVTEQNISFLKDKKTDVYMLASKDRKNLKLSNMKGSFDGVSLTGDAHLIENRLTGNIDTVKLDLEGYGNYLSLVKGLLDKNKTGLALNIKTKQAIFGKEKFDNFSAQLETTAKDIQIKKADLSWRSAPHQLKGNIAWDGSYDFDITTNSIGSDVFNAVLPIESKSISAQTQLSGKAEKFSGKTELRISSGVLSKMDLNALSAGINQEENIDALLKESFRKGKTAFSLATAKIDFDVTKIDFISFDIAGEFGKVTGEKGYYHFRDKSYQIDMNVALVSPTGVPVFGVNYMNNGTDFSAKALKDFALKSREPNIEGILRRLEKERLQGASPAAE